MHKRNADIASLLRQIGELEEEQGEPFKPAAYRRAAKTIEKLPKDIATFKTVKELKELPGVGEAIAEKILEYFETGHMRKLDHLLIDRGGLSPALMAVEDLGGKRVREIQKSLGITTVPELIKAAEEGKLRSLPRMSELMEQKILFNAKRVKERSRRFPRTEVEKDVSTLLRTLRAVPGVEKCDVGGSFRRHKETVGDIDILVVALKREKVMQAIASLPIVAKVVAQGDTKLSFDLTIGIRVDLRFVERNQWGAALLYFTGDKEHNISLRKVAIGKGWKLNEYGLFEGERIVASKEEKDIYDALGFPWIDPKERTGELPTSNHRS